MKYTCSMGDVVRARPLLTVLLLLTGLVLANCGEESSGDSEGSTPKGPTVAQWVTRDFGQEELSSESAAPIKGHGTTMRLLKEHTDVKTVVQGRVVESIDGVQQDIENGTTTWASFVNGVETDLFPTEQKVFPGDVVQWDLRDWYVTLDVRATVGAFPEFFTHGFEGKRIPIRVLCEDDSSPACRRVKRTLQAAGVRLGKSPKASKYDGTVLVGKWNHWRDRPWPRRLDDGPSYSGIFARFSPKGDELNLLDWNAHFSRTESGDIGLVAAHRPTEADFQWFVTGTTDEGVDRASQALDSERLRNAYALVVLPDGDEKIPVEPD